MFIQSTPCACARSQQFSACVNLFQKFSSSMVPVFNPVLLLSIQQISTHIHLNSWGISLSSCCEREPDYIKKGYKGISTTTLQHSCKKPLPLSTSSSLSGGGEVSVARLSCCRTWCRFSGCKLIFIYINSCVHLWLSSKLQKLEQLF